LIEVAFFLRKECEVIKYFFGVCPKEITVQRFFIITQRQWVISSPPWVKLGYLSATTM
jgi:hypothetical protein